MSSDWDHPVRNNRIAKVFGEEFKFYQRKSPVKVTKYLSEDTFSCWSRCLFKHTEGSPNIDFANLWRDPSSFVPNIPQPPTPLIMNQSAQTNFLSSALSNVHQIDPDTSRFIDMMTMHRQQFGLSTYMRRVVIPSNYDVTSQLLAEPIISEFDTFFDSNKYFRAFKMRNVKLTAQQLHRTSNHTEGVVEVPELYTLIVRIDGQWSVFLAGDREKVFHYEATYRQAYTEPNTIEIERLLGFDGAGNASMKSNTLDEKEQEFGHDAFYPFLGQTVDEFINDYSNAKAAVLILIGPAGTGKSTFLRTMNFRMKKIKKRYAISTEAAFLHPSLINFLENTGERPFIYIEDADRLVSPRKDGNDQMSMLLNFANGVVTNHPKLVISTNLESISKIDSALLRAGRTYKVQEFRKLTIDEANAARACLGRDPIDPSNVPLSSLSLAEALEYTKPQDLNNRRHVAAGFVPST